jgi:release factor glutamine methyltransferase
MLKSADYLAEKGVETARLDAEYLLAHVMGVGRLEMYLQHERPIEANELDRFRPLLRRRGKREPLQYILGRQGFRELDLEVGPGVLVPRPETERLVEEILAWAEGHEELTFLDVGTGSGAIGLSLLAEGPFTRGVGSDASPSALEYARKNREAAGLESRLELRPGRLFEVVRSGERFDVVVSNPPYVAESERAALEPEITEWEPAEGLFAGPDGLAVIRDIVSGARAVLTPGGLLALEVGADQGDAVVQLVEGAGVYEEVAVRRDLSGRERIVTAVAGPKARE